MFGAFIFSWVAFNWESILILLLSNYPIEVKIGAIKSNLNILTGLLYPFASSFSLCFVLPNINYLIIKLQNKPIIKSINKYNNRKEETLAGIVKTEKLKARSESAYDEELEAIKLDKQEIREKIKDSEDRILEKDNKIEILEDEIKNLEKKLEKESQDREYYKRNYSTNQDAGRRIYEKYPYLFQPDEAGVIMEKVYTNEYMRKYIDEKIQEINEYLSAMAPD
ncbi:hypothetical protein [Serratia rubidaea]|uniref:hypothetical protein n=1 Tax=Serratia rubidaea TaxID=61652 RepID=UPI003FA38A39